MSLRGCFTTQSARHRLCPSPRKHVERGVVVSIENQSAVRAMVGALRQRLSRGRFAPTAAAYLARSTRIHKDDFLPGAFCLEREGVCELTPRCVMDTSSHARAGESVDVQVLNGDKVIFGQQLACSLEREVFAGVGNGAVPSGQRAAPLPAIATAPLHLGKAALRSFDDVLAGPQVARVGNLATVCERSEVGEAEVDAGLLARERKEFLRHVLTREGDEPVAAPVALERHGFDGALNRPGQEQFSTTNASEREPASFHLESAALGPITHRVKTTRRTEARESDNAGGSHSTKESLTACVQVLKDFLACPPIDGAEIIADAPDFRELVDLVVEGNRDARTSIPGDSFLKRGIVQLAQKVELLLGVSGNGWRQFSLEAKGFSHA